MVSSTTKSVAIAVVILVSTAEAHNQMTLPLPTWPENFYSRNSPSGIIDPSVLPVPSGMSYNTDPNSNTEAYWTAFNASSYKSLKELVWDAQTLEPGASNECGTSIVDGVPQDLPDQIQWDAFTHAGPFEAYCDEILVFQSNNAAAEFPESPANTPYDKEKCTGASLLTSYWLGLHTTPWQVYTNCAPLTGASNSPGPSPNDDDDYGSTDDDPETDPSPNPSPNTSPNPSPNSNPSPKPNTNTGGGSPPASSKPPAKKCSPRRQRD